MTWKGFLEERIKSKTETDELAKEVRLAQQLLYERREEIESQNKQLELLEDEDEWYIIRVRTLENELVNQVESPKEKEKEPNAKYRKSEEYRKLEEDQKNREEERAKNGNMW